MAHVLNLPPRLSRRHLLRGLGATIALPWLECMGAATPTKASPTRVAFLFMPNGVNADRWSPQGEGRDFELSPTLAPLQNHKENLLVLSELMNANSLGGDGHYAKTANWLTGTPITKTTGKDLYCGGTSVDQLVAQKWGQLTRLPSLELGTEPVTTGVDTNVNYTRLYGSHISWSTPTTPIPCEINPRVAFDRLFRSNHTIDPQEIASNRSVLDLVLEDAKDLHRQVGKADQQKLDEYLESIRAIERRIEHDAARVASGENADPVFLDALRAMEARLDRTLGADSAGLPRIDHTEHVRLMFDLLALAFWSDSTRVSTFMFGNAVSGRNFSFLDGVDGSHHEISHHNNDPAKLVQYELINRWHVEQYGYFLDRLSAIQEGDHNLLDQSMILLGSGLRDGNSHNPRNLPIILAGKGGGRLRPGRHVRSPENTPLCNLFVSMLENLDVPTRQFGDSTGTLELS